MMSLGEELDMAAKSTVDCTEAISNALRPYGRGIAKIFITIFHMVQTYYFLFQFKSSAIFVTLELGLLGSGEDGSYPKEMNAACWVVGAVLLVTRVVGLVLVFRKQHVIEGAIVLALHPLIDALRSILNASSFGLLVLSISLIGYLVILAAEGLEDRDAGFAGLLSLTTTKKVSIVQLVARFNLIIGFIGVLYIEKREFTDLHWFDVILNFVLIGALIVGYKTKIAALILAGVILITQATTNPWLYHLADGNAVRFWLHTEIFGFYLSAIGSLIYIAILGPGQYSVDHLRKSN